MPGSAATALRASPTSSISSPLNATSRQRGLTGSVGPARGLVGGHTARGIKRGRLPALASPEGAIGPGWTPPPSQRLAPVQQRRPAVKRPLSAEAEGEGMALRPDTRRLGKGAALPRPLPLPRQGAQTPEAGGRLALDCSIHFTH